MSDEDDDLNATTKEGEADAKPRAELTGGQVLEMIAKGQTVANAKISRLKLKGTIPNNIKFANCVLIKPDFDGATFEGQVEFFHCTIDRPHFNRSNEFKKDLNLGNCTLLKATFRGVTVGGTLKMMNAVVKGKAQFSNCTFGKVFMWETHLDGWVDWKGCTFVGECDMRSVHYDQGLVFNKSHFQGDFLLRGATVAKKLEFGNSKFEQLLDLSKAKLHDFVYMENIEQGEHMRFAFWNALAERVLVKPEQIEGRLASEGKSDCGVAMQEYGLLKRAFESQHRYDYEDWAFYRFKVNQRRGCGRSWRRPWTKVSQFFNWLLLDLGCGYGTNPMRAVVASLVIIVAFGLIYMTDVNAISTEKLPFPSEDKDSTGNTIMIGLLTSVSVFTSGMAGIRDLATGWMNVPLIIESLLGTFLFGLFIVAFSRKVIR